MHFAELRLAFIAVVIALGSRATASDSEDASLDALRSEVAALKEMVAALTTTVQRLEQRIESLQGDGGNQLSNSNDYEMPVNHVLGTWAADLEIEFKRSHHLYDHPLSPPVNVKPDFGNPHFQLR
jgi:hypothetical protein